MSTGSAIFILGLVIIGLGAIFFGFILGCGRVSKDADEVTKEHLDKIRNSRYPNGTGE